MAGRVVQRPPEEQVLGRVVQRPVQGPGLVMARVLPKAGDGPSAHPTILRSAVGAQDPIHKGNICLNGLLCIAGGDRSLADFFELTIGPDGMAQIAYADNFGYGGKTGRVVWAKQTGGRSALK